MPVQGIPATEYPPKERQPKECKSNQKVHRSEESGRFFKNPSFDHGCLFPSHLRVDYPMSRSPGSRRYDPCDQKELQGRPRRHPSRQNHPPFFQALPLGIPSLGTPGQPCPPARCQAPVGSPMDLDLLAIPAPPARCQAPLGSPADLDLLAIPAPPARCQAPVASPEDLDLLAIAAPPARCQAPLGSPEDLDLLAFPAPPARCQAPLGSPADLDLLAIPAPLKGARHL
jgi:hypothetical protein